jgi:hypothetical protein
MRYLVSGLAALLAALLVACGGDDDGAGSELTEQVAEVCTETDEVAGEDVLVVETPEPGDVIEETLRVSGEIAAFQGTVWISVVKADGEHIVDAPRMTSDPENEQLTPFDVELPAQVSESTPACVWVYRQSSPDPPEAVKIPVTLEPPS